VISRALSERTVSHLAIPTDIQVAEVADTGIGRAVTIPRPDRL
jgi:hypothetical protein